MTVGPFCQDQTVHHESKYGTTCVSLLTSIPGQDSSLDSMETFRWWHVQKIERCSTNVTNMVTLPYLALLQRHFHYYDYMYYSL
jgi:hypothetical protein